MNSTRLGPFVAVLLAGLLAGCAVVETRGGPPPHAPAWGARAKAKPPKIVITPSVVVIAGSQVAFAENYPDDLFFFQGRWYRPYQGTWYWSVSVSGDWLDLSVGQVPRAVLEVPSDYRAKAKKGGPPPRAPAHGRRAKEKD